MRGNSSGGGGWSAVDCLRLRGLSARDREQGGPCGIACVSRPRPPPPWQPGAPPLRAALWASEPSCCSSPLSRTVSNCSRHITRLLSFSLPSSFQQVGGQSGWRRGFCDGQSPWDRQGKNGGAFVGGEEHLRTVSEENYVQRVGWRGDAGASGPPSFHPPPPDPGFSSPPPHGYSSTVPHPPGFRHRGPQSYGPPGPRGLWRPVRPDFGPRPPFHGAPPRQSWQGPRPAFRPHPPRPRLPPADFRNWVSSSLPPPAAECGKWTVSRPFFIDSFPDDSGDKFLSRVLEPGIPHTHLHHWPHRTRVVLNFSVVARGRTPCKSFWFYSPHREQWVVL